MGEIAIIEKWHILINILDIWPTNNIWWPLEYSWVMLKSFAVLIDRWIAPLWCTGVTGWSKNHTRGAILTSFSTYFDQIELFYGQQTIFDDPYINPGCIVNKLNLTCKLRNRFIPMVRNYWHKRNSQNNFYGYKMKACMEKHRKTKYSICSLFALDEAWGGWGPCGRLRAVRRPWGRLGDWGLYFIRMLSNSQ